MIEKVTLKEAEGALTKTNKLEYVRGLDKNGNPISINKEDLAAVLGGLIGEAKYNKPGLLSSKDARVHIVIPAYETNPTKALKIGAKNGLTFFASISTGGSSSNLYFVALKDNDIMEVKVKLLYRGSTTNEFRIYYKDGYIYLQTRYSGLPSCIQPMANGALISVENNVNFDKTGMIESIYE